MIVVFVVAVIVATAYAMVTNVVVAVAAQAPPQLTDVQQKNITRVLSKKLIDAQTRNSS